MKLKNKLLNEMQSTSTVTFYTSDKELLREAILAEYDASNLYHQMAKKAQSQDVKRVLLHVANEEKEHIGEFEALLEKLDPDHEKHEEEGEKEVKNMGIHISDE